MDSYQIGNTILISINDFAFICASFIIPYLYRRTNVQKTRYEEINKQLLNAFENYMGENKVFDFEWYCAQINAIALKSSINQVLCLNCKLHSPWKTYMDFFKKSDKIIPELNNFSFGLKKIKTNRSFMVLTCQKCRAKVNKVLK